MLSEERVRLLLGLNNSLLSAYNISFRAGYKMALEDVLEIKRPKAKPASKSIVLGNEGLEYKKLKEEVL